MIRENTAVKILGVVFIVIGSITFVRICVLIAKEIGQVILHFFLEGNVDVQLDVDRFVDL